MSTSIFNPMLMTLNHLDHPVASRSLTHEQLHPESPVAIKKNLGLDELNEKLFPTLKTGVRWWPFLCSAMDCTTESDRQAVYRATRKLKVGPETQGTLRPYISMAKSIQANRESQDLFKYLQKRFDGNPSFFINNHHEEKWKDLLMKANGEPAVGYVRAYRATRVQIGFDPEADRVVTYILSQPPTKYNLVLWQGAFSFALIRCLFGIYDREASKAINHSLVIDWKRLLISILQKPPSDVRMGSISTYLMLLEQIADEKSPPPLAGQTRLFRDKGKPVLASLRIPLFHRLYFKPTPSNLDRRHG